MLQSFVRAHFIVALFTIAGCAAGESNRGSASGGATVAEAEPGTDDDASLELDCPAGACDQVCPEGGDCSFTCTGGGCHQICSEGALCDMTCGSGCRLECHADAECTGACSAGCAQACDPGASCEFDCGTQCSCDGRPC